MVWNEGYTGYTGQEFWIWKCQAGEKRKISEDVVEEDIQRAVWQRSHGDRMRWRFVISYSFFTLFSLLWSPVAIEDSRGFLSSAEKSRPIHTYCQCCFALHHIVSDCRLMCVKTITTLCSNWPQRMGEGFSCALKKLQHMSQLWKSSA